MTYSDNNEEMDDILGFRKYFEALPLIRVYGSSRLISCVYDIRFSCVVTRWKNGQLIVYYGNPPSRLVEECFEKRSGQPIYNCGYPYIVFQ